MTSDSGRKSRNHCTLGGMWGSSDAAKTPKRNKTSFGNVGFDFHAITAWLACFVTDAPATNRGFTKFLDQDGNGDGEDDDDDDDDHDHDEGGR